MYIDKLLNAFNFISEVDSKYMNNVNIDSLSLEERMVFITNQFRDRYKLYYKMIMEMNALIKVNQRYPEMVRYSLN